MSIISQELIDDDIFFSKFLEMRIQETMELFQCPACDCSPVDPDDNCDCECHD